MVSKARDDFPEPDRPVITTNLSLGMESETFLRLWTRAPLMEMTFATGGDERDKARGFFARKLGSELRSDRAHSPRPQSSTARERFLEQSSLYQPRTLSRGEKKEYRKSMSRSIS